MNINIRIFEIGTVVFRHKIKLFESIIETV